MPTKIHTEPPYGELVCECGSREWTFCDREGHAIDRNELWRGFYLCDGCGLVAYWPSAEVVRRP